MSIKASNVARILRKARQRGIVWTLEAVKRRIVRATRAEPTLRGVTMTVSTYCNLKCTGCPHGLFGDADKIHMPLDRFQRVIDNLPSAGSLMMVGLGEPSLNKDLPEMIAYAHKSRKFGDLVFISNLLARPPEFYIDLFDRGLTGLQVSVDAFDSDIADNTRLGTQVDKLRQRLETVVLAVNSRIPRIGIKTVVSRVNLDHLWDLATEFNRLGEACGEPLAWGLQAFDPKVRSDMALDDELLLKANQLVDRMRAEFKWIKLKGHVTIVESSCPEPFSGAAVSVEGYLLPCTDAWDPSVYGRFALDRTPWTEAAATPEIKDFRDSFPTTRHELCEKCFCRYGPSVNGCGR